MSELAHFHSNFRFVIVVDNIHDVQTKMLDLAEKAFLIGPNCLKHWFSLLLHLKPWPAFAMSKVACNLSRRIFVL